jgi:arginine exporter protein ArgO
MFQDMGRDPAVGWLNPHLIGTRSQVGTTGYVANMSTDLAFRVAATVAAPWLPILTGCARRA